MATTEKAAKTASKTQKTEKVATQPKPREKRDPSQFAPKGYVYMDEAREALGVNSNGGVYPYMTKTYPGTDEVMLKTIRVKGFRGRFTEKKSLDKLTKWLHDHREAKAKEEPKSETKAETPKAKTPAPRRAAPKPQPQAQAGA